VENANSEPTPYRFLHAISIRILICSKISSLNIVVPGVGLEPTKAFARGS
jgi:hypothetical protein